MRSCEYQDKTRKEINTTDVSAHSCRAVGSNMQTRLLHQSFYLFFVDYNHHKYLGREFNNTHCPIQFFFCRLFKGDQSKLSYIVTAQHYPYRI